MADKEYIIELIKKELIRNPGVTVRELMEKFDIAMNTSVKYRKIAVKQRKKEIEKEIEKLKGKTLEEELAEYEDHIKEVIKELWQIINDRKATRKEKIRAIKEIVGARSELFERKFDAGLFAKKLGEADLNIPGLVKLINENTEGKETEDNNKSGSEL